MRCTSQKIYKITGARVSKIGTYNSKVSNVSSTSSILAAQRSPFNTL